MDRVDVATRSRNMAAIRSSGNRSTELAMVALLKTHRLSGWRRGVPLLGRPDFVWRREKIALFVDGCFWHGCIKCRKAPANNAEYWQKKIERNASRDMAVNAELRRNGWRVVRIWECQIKKQISLTKLRKLLSKSDTNSVATDPYRKRFSE